MEGIWCRGFGRTRIRGIGVRENWGTGHLGYGRPGVEGTCWYRAPAGIGHLLVSGTCWYRAPAGIGHLLVSGTWGSRKLGFRKRGTGTGVRWIEIRW